LGLTDDWIPASQIAWQFKKHSNSICHAGLDPASSTAALWKRTGFPFDVAQGGEPVEPRVKPGMTKVGIYEVLSIATQSLKGWD
jgi:hypothetical protein